MDFGVSRSKTPNTAAAAPIFDSSLHEIISTHDRLGNGLEALPVAGSGIEGARLVATDHTDRPSLRMGDTRSFMPALDGRRRSIASGAYGRHPGSVGGEGRQQKRGNYEQAGDGHAGAASPARHIGTGPAGGEPGHGGMGLRV